MCREPVFRRSEGKHIQCRSVFGDVIAGRSESTSDMPLFRARIAFRATSSCSKRSVELGWDWNTV